jgi:hypothetical protein
VSGDSNGIGSFALLRVAAFPSEVWLQAASPSLFRLIQRTRDVEASYYISGREAAAQIGFELIPCPEIPKGDRTMALQIRRLLYQHRVVEPNLLGGITELAERFLPQSSSLPKALAMTRDRLTLLLDLEAQLRTAVTQEEMRLLELPWALAQSTPIVTRAMRQSNEDLYREIAHRVTSGESWETKRMRQRSKYLWRLIDRGTIKPTPRGWFAHVGLVPVADAEPGTPEFMVTETMATQWLDNLYMSRRLAVETGLEQAAPETLLGLTPLHWRDGPWFEAWVPKVSPSIEVDVTSAKLRRTPLLEAICQELQFGARPLGEVEIAVAESVGVPQRAVVRGFLTYLANIGIIEVSQPLQSHFRAWGIVDSPGPGGNSPNCTPIVGEAQSVRESSNDGSSYDGNKGYLDVYRRVVSSRAGALCEEVATLTDSALRILRMMDNGTSRPERMRAADITAEPCSVLDLLRQRTYAVQSGTRQPLRGGWPSPASADSPYAKLVKWIDEHSDQPALELTPGILDELDAPQADLVWPLDCLIRLLSPDSLSDPAAALDTLFPAGALDARFAEGLGYLYGPVANVESYREFLREVEERTGYLFVEVLVPPLVARAANALRRPLYTSAWTGDADLGTYCLRANGARFIPLNSIMLRPVGNRILATVDEQPIWPLHHTTRTTLPPWTEVVTLLLSAAPRPLDYVSMVNLQRSIDAFPHRTHLPRITICQHLVVSCEQWRLSESQLWKPGDSAVAKARKLDRIRHQLRLPRWVFLMDPRPGSSVCCDLESLRSIRAIDDALESAAKTIVLAESLPAPHKFPVTDNAQGLHARTAAELLIRLPLMEPPHILASRIAQTLHGSQGFPSTDSAMKCGLSCKGILE